MSPMNPLLNALLAAGGLALLCAFWTLLQLWMREQDPNYEPGRCAGCAGHGCGEQTECSRSGSRVSP